MSLPLIALLLGFVGIAVSVNPFLKNIKKHKVKVYFSLAGWTSFIFLLGLALGFGLSKFQQMTGMIILFSLFGCIPFYAWLDAKVIYKNKSWGVKEYIWGCLYELGVVSAGAGLYLSIVLD